MIRFLEIGNQAPSSYFGQQNVGLYFPVHPWPSYHCISNKEPGIRSVYGFSPWLPAVVVTGCPGSYFGGPPNHSRPMCLVVHSGRAGLSLRSREVQRASKAAHGDATSRRDEERGAGAPTVQDRLHTRWLVEEGFGTSESQTSARRSRCETSHPTIHRGCG